MLTKEEIAKVLKEGVKLNFNSLYHDLEEYESKNDCIESTLPNLLEQTFASYGAGLRKQPEGFKIALEEQFGGEGKGENYWLVFSVVSTATNEIVFIRFNGWYSSDDGLHFEETGFELVEPRQVSVRQWFEAIP
jgi:hypothetical protein